MYRTPGYSGKYRLCSVRCRTDHCRRSHQRPDKGCPGDGRKRRKSAVIKKDYRKVWVFPGAFLDFRRRVEEKNNSQEAPGFLCVSAFLNFSGHCGMMMQEKKGIVQSQPPKCCAFRRCGVSAKWIYVQKCSFMQA